VEDHNYPTENDASMLGEGFMRTLTWPAYAPTALSD